MWTNVDSQGGAELKNSISKLQARKLQVESEISSRAERRDELMLELGNALFEETRYKAEFFERHSLLYTAITEREQQSEKLQAELAEIDEQIEAEEQALAEAQAAQAKAEAQAAAAQRAPGAIICSTCGKSNGAASKFCVGCGSRLEPARPAPRFCNACGAAIMPEDRFCTECGAPQPTYVEASALPRAVVSEPAVAEKNTSAALPVDATLEKVVETDKTAVTKAVVKAEADAGASKTVSPVAGAGAKATARTSKATGSDKVAAQKKSAVAKPAATKKSAAAKKPVAESTTAKKPAASAKSAAAKKTTSAEKPAAAKKDVRVN